MKIKSYFAATIAEAIANARRELGPDAMIVASRKTGPESMHLGLYEVVLGVMESGKKAPPSQPVKRTLSSLPEKETPKPVLPQIPAEVKPGRRIPAATLTAVSQTDVPEQGAPVKLTTVPGKLTRLLQQVDSIRDSISKKKSQVSESNVYENPDLSAIHTRLLASGFGQELSESLTQSVKRRCKQPSTKLESLTASPAESALREELKARLQLAPELGIARAERRIVALVGPPGAGKTSMLVKLAVNYGLTGRRSMQIFSMDTYRLGGSDQLRTYAAAMGTPFEALQTTAALSQALEDSQSKGLILIDTPGYGSADVESASQLASFLSRHPEIDMQLVLPAYMSADDMEKTATRFRSFLPSKIMYTNLDGLASTGPLLAQALRTETPISFLGTGQQVPEDLSEATATKLLDGFLAGTCKTAAESAA